MVIADNEVKLKDIQSRVVENNLVFGNIAAISITSISRTLAKHRVRMKQLYKVPFERNSERIKELRRQYVQVRLCNTVITVHYIVCFAVNFSINLEYSRTYSKAFTHTVSDYFQRVMELEANQVPHEMIYVDEAGFNLAKRRRRGRNIIGKRATVTVPGQRGANITMCAAISINGALLNKCVIGPSEDDVPFRCPLLPFPQPHWGVFLSLEMEGFWPSSTGPNVPPGCNGCCMPRHHSWTLPGVDKAYQKILPKMPCQRRYQMWCGWEHVAKRRRPGRLDYIYYYCIMF